MTASIGALIQHDASTHLWCPQAQEKWTLITSIDDYSRKPLFADFFPRETTWAHIQATQAVMPEYGLPLRCYVDSLRVYRFVQGRDSVWRKYVMRTDGVETQWRKIMRLLDVDVSYALLPQVKGKVERPYRRLQDRIVRTCIYENLSTMVEARIALQAELHRYNNQQIHSTTGEIPNIRFERARREGNSLFRKLVIPKPYASSQDVFCLREQRMVNAYRRISLFNHAIEVPHVPLRVYVEVHMVPDETRQRMHIRIWWNDSMVHSLSLPLHGFRVHFSTSASNCCAIPGRCFAGTTRFPWVPALETACDSIRSCLIMTLHTVSQTDGKIGHLASIGIPQMGDASERFLRYTGLG